MIAVTRFVLAKLRQFVEKRFSLKSKRNVCKSYVRLGILQWL